MSAEIHCALWGEPAQPEVVALGDEVRRFREIIFCGDGLKQFILRPTGWGIDRRRVAAKMVSVNAFTRNTDTCITVFFLNRKPSTII
jgi:hypothetical protein